MGPPSLRDAGFEQQLIITFAWIHDDQAILDIFCRALLVAVSTTYSWTNSDK